MHGDLPRLLQSQHEDMMIRFDHQQDAQHCATGGLRLRYV